MEDSWLSTFNGYFEYETEFEERDYLKLRENEKPLSLDSLAFSPDRCIVAILNKLDRKTFDAMEATCSYMAIACNSSEVSIEQNFDVLLINKVSLKLMEKATIYSEMRNRPRIKFSSVSTPNVRIRADYSVIKVVINSRRARRLTHLFKRNKTRVDNMTIYKVFKCSAEEFSNLMLAIQVTKLMAMAVLPRDLYRTPGFHQLTQVHLGVCDMRDEELLFLTSLEFLTMTNDSLSADGLCNFLKQWKRRERQINFAEVIFNHSAGSRSFDLILDGVNANVIWTPDFHENSVIHRIRLEDYHPFQSGDPSDIYSMFRSDEINNFRIIRISNHRFQIYNQDMTFNSENTFLINNLKRNDYYTVTGRCKYCLQPKCLHSRLPPRNILTQLSKKFPKIYERFFCGLLTTNVLLELESFFNQLIQLKISPYLCDQLIHFY